MADKNDGKPGDAGSSGKKPKPLLDLKATEVQSSAPGDSSKPAQSSTLKGAPGVSVPSSDGKVGDPKSGEGKASSVPPTAAAGTSSSSSTGASSGASSGSGPRNLSGVASSSSYGTTSAKPSSSSGDTSKPGASAASPASSGGSTTSSATSANVGAAVGGGASASQRASGSSSSGGSDGHGGSASTGGGAKGRSGGGFVSTLSHLAAGIVGGGVALFAAGPIDNELGLGLMPKPEVPAAIEQRLAALEARPQRAEADVATQTAITSLSEQLAAADKRLDALDGLQAEVANLASDIKKAQSGSGSGEARSADTSGSSTAGSAESSTLRARLAKLESQLATLSSATSSGGAPPAIAPLAQFSAKFADLEGSLGTQLSSLRKSLVSEMDSRIGKASDASAKAIAGAERLDREVADIKTDTARLDQRASVLKSATDKLNASMLAVSEQATEIKVELDALKGSVKQELERVARPADIQQAIEPVSKQVASLASDLGAVVASETARKKNAERIVLSLELSNLKRVLDRGVPFAAELADVKKIAGDAIDFSALDAHKDVGVPSAQELTRQFRTVAYKIITAEEAPDQNASRIDKLFAAAKSIVKVRRTDVPAEEKTAEAAVAQIEKRLKAGDMAGALALTEKLPEATKASAGTWMSQLAARAEVDRAIAKIEDQLKASLGTGPTGGEKKG